MKEEKNSSISTEGIFMEEKQNMKDEKIYSNLTERIKRRTRQNE